MEDNRTIYRALTLKSLEKATTHLSNALINLKLSQHKPHQWPESYTKELQQYYEKLRNIHSEVHDIHQHL